MKSEILTALMLVLFAISTPFWGVACQFSDSTTFTEGGFDENTPSQKVPSDPSDNNSSLDSEEETFLAQINEYRASQGREKLQLSPTLTAASKWLAEDMATHETLNHTDTQGRSFSNRLRAFGYTSSSTIGENIAYGNETALGTFNQWKNSPAHNTNMLSPNYRAIGIGRFNHSGSTWGWYWATDFGGTID